MLGGFILYRPKKWLVRRAIIARSAHALQCSKNGPTVVELVLVKGGPDIDYKMRPSGQLGSLSL